MLGPRALNRALIARQMLAERAGVSASEALKRLVGMQAQLPNAPYFGLWSRIADFRPEELSGLIERHKAVRVVLMRGTIHLVTAGDCLELRPLVQVVLDRQLQGSRGRLLDGLDLDAVASEGRRMVESQPLTSRELGEALAKRWSDRDADALAQTVRARVPLVQIPPKGLWGKGGQTRLTSAESWLGRPTRTDPSIDALVLRYLASFGPATVKDIQTWSGLTRLGEVVARLDHCTVSFTDERGRRLFDLPDAPRPDPERPLPPRFLPEFDNLLLSHDDRTRIVRDEHRHLVYSRNGFMRTVLIDGFAGASWTIHKQRGSVALVVEPFERLTKKTAAAVTEEGRRLLDFAAPGADEVRIADPD